jgi:hypothetical protein
MAATRARFIAIQRQNTPRRHFPHQRTHRIAHGHRLDKVFEILVPSISVIGQRPPP